MICPKCKTKVSSNDTNCPNCNLRLIFKCPRCGSPTRLGSVSCKKCGYTFVKFCPNCHSANYATSSICRKCGLEFENGESKQIATPKLLSESAPPIKKIDLEAGKETLHIEMEGESDIKNLVVYVDFTNLEDIFEKYNTDNFKTKVIQNIKTTIKLSFGAECEFINPRCLVFTLGQRKNSKIMDKITRFEAECAKFNEILEKTLNCDILYKFAITTEEEIKDTDEIPQLKLGSDKDIVVSSGAYSALSSEISLIKISTDSYKMIFLDQKPIFKETHDVKYSKALELVLENLADANSSVRAISINAPRGCGKTHLLNDLYFRINRIKTQSTIIFFAHCSALTQVSPYGLIQNFFISFFDCPVVVKDEFNIKEFEKIVLEKLHLEHIEEETLETIANLIYPIKRDYYENILINKEITYKYLKEIFDYIKQRKNVIFMIDDFDLIDESSFGFLKYLVNENYFEHSAKMILGYKNPHSVAIYFQSSKFNNNNCLNISLRSLNSTECKNFAKNILGPDSKIPENVLSQIAYNSQGNIAYIEQVIHYLFEKKIFEIKDKIVVCKYDINNIDALPSSLEDCFLARLDYLRAESTKEYMFLMAASLLGDTINYSVLNSIYNYEENEFFEIVKSLDKKGYLKRQAQDTYGFRNSLTWSYCYIRAKEEELIKTDAKKLLIELNNKTISTPLLCPILAQIIDNKELALNLWTKNLQFASYIGDINIYTMAQKQSLILLENSQLENFDTVKNNICERLGKLLYSKNPQEAKGYLTNAIVAAQNAKDANAVIDLSGYLVKTLYLIQDFSGVVEVVDNVLKYFDEHEGEKKSDIELQIALIKTRKLEALLALGSWEQISSIVQTEIKPILQKHLNIFSNHKWVKYSEIFFSWIEANIILAQSYCEQGSPIAFELIDEINKILSRERGAKIDNLKVRLAYASAIANTSRGYFEESNAILQGIAKDYSYVIDNPMFVCKWNIINVINKILSCSFEGIKEELFEATAYADNCSDELSKNLLKTLLAYVFLEEKNYVKAVEIAGEQVQYFSKKKIAFGALLAWYISAAAMTNNKADKYCIEICEKAVKVCEDAQNNNFYFKIMFQELLSIFYLKLNDRQNAKMYCDLALQSASANELLYLQVRLNNLKARIMREELSHQPDNKKYDYAQNTIRMYNRTIEMAKLLKLSNTTQKIEKELISFKAHCQLNRIIEDK